MESELSAAMQIVLKALKNDPEYKAVWMANLTMAFRDTMTDFGGQEYHEPVDIAKAGADRFMNLLLTGIK